MPKVAREKEELSEIETMRKMFPKCPICGSNEGYEYSAFIPDVKCKWCNAEWSLRKDSMVLRRVSDKAWDEEFLNKELPFEFWIFLTKL